MGRRLSRVRGMASGAVSGENVREGGVEGRLALRGPKVSIWVSLVVYTMTAQSVIESTEVYAPARSVVTTAMSIHFPDSSCGPSGT